VLPHKNTFIDPPTTPLTHSSMSSAINGATPSLTSESTQYPSGQPSSSKGPGSPAGAIAGAVVAGVLVLLAGMALFYIIRRKRRAQRQQVSATELGSLDYEATPNLDKEFLPDPFVTDAQARSMGMDISRQPIRRIEAKFLIVDPPRSGSPLRPSSSASSQTGAPRNNVPIIRLHPAPPAQSSWSEEKDQPADARSSQVPESASNQQSLDPPPSDPIVRSSRANIPSPDPQIAPKMQELVAQLGLDDSPRFSPPENLTTNGHISDTNTS